MKIKIRKTKDQDCRRAAHVHRSSIKVLCGPSYHQEIIDAWAGGCSAGGVRRALKRKDINNIVAEVNGIVCGVAASKNNRIWLLYVHPNWAGNGIGEKLLKRLENDMLQKNIKNISLESSKNAFNFYLRNGYIKVKRKKLVFNHGLSIACIEMKKRLR
jgi:putative acetyltransferase